MPARSETSPWTIKNVSVQARDRALRYATMAGESLAVWVTDAIEIKVERQEATTVIPAGNPGNPMQAGNPGGVTVPGNLDDLCRAVASAKVLADAPPDALPRYLRQTLARALDDAVRAMRGLPPRARKVSKAVPRIAGE